MNEYAEQQISDCEFEAMAMELLKVLKRSCCTSGTSKNTFRAKEPWKPSINTKNVREKHRFYAPPREECLYAYQNYSLTPPAVSPPIIYFWRVRVKMITGMSIIVPAAASCPHLGAY